MIAGCNPIVWLFCLWKTELGRKRQIDQSACNKDFSCIKGFCPSFVSVKGGQLRKPEAQKLETNLPAPPAVFSLVEPISIVLTGVGGNRVVTIAALLGMAAHLEGKGRNYRYGRPGTKRRCGN